MKNNNKMENATLGLRSGEEVEIPEDKESTRQVHPFFAGIALHGPLLQITSPGQVKQENTKPGLG